MAKIQTVEELDSKIDSEIAWRKQELTYALQLVQTTNGPAQKEAIRSGVLILYAHWEGWVKAVSKFYVRYVNTRAYSYNLLSDSFLGNALKTKIMSLESASTPELHRDFASFLRAGLDGRSSLSEDLISAKSNLSSTVFFEILDRLGLDSEPYSSRANMIDTSLLKRRNDIAHGEYLPVDLEGFKELRDGVMDILGRFTDDVRNAAARDLHLCAE